MQHHAVYGLSVASDFAFTWPLARARSERPADLTFTCVEHAPLAVDWDAVRPVYEVASSGDPERPDIRYYRLGDLDVVRVRGAADHYLLDGDIVCHLHDASLAYLVEIQLLGMVLALWLERHGVAVLHASCVVVDGSAVAFLGTKGGGKTTAATALLAAGHPLLVDDLLALRLDEPPVVLAQPGYPMLRLWPEQADHFLGGHDTLPLVHPSYTKRRVLVGRHIGTFAAEPAVLRRVYLPVRTAGGHVAIEPAASREALLAMLSETFLREATHGLGLAAAQLPRLAAVARGVPVRTLRYPHGFDRLPELVAAVEADVRG